MFESVLLPAPFSPSSACTSPAAASKSTPSLATTPGNRFVIPRRTTAASEEAAVVTTRPSAIPSRRNGPLALGAALDALDEPVHRVQVLDGHPLALRDPHLAALVAQRPRELVEGALDQRLPLRRDQLLRLRRHLRPVRRQADEPILERAVVEAGLPGAVHRRLDALDVVRPPVVDGGRQPRRRRELLRVRVVADPRDPL